MNALGNTVSTLIKIGLVIWLLPIAIAFIGAFAH